MSLGNAKPAREKKKLIFLVGKRSISRKEARGLRGVYEHILCQLPVIAYTCLIWVTSKEEKKKGQE